ncbi:uncharacterized protein LOC108595589 [Drosophila busckii]|uniref:uncharacterized protein LOC108595589 n=1 Tax=Drosophila busckii TaxID=30019 RepID=UPI00083EFE77|nr:uncharacterized protein LOC108595589 [Drosophila busckii]
MKSMNLYCNGLKLFRQLLNHCNPLMQMRTKTDSLQLPRTESLEEKVHRLMMERVKKKTPCYLVVRRSEYKCKAYQEMDEIKGVCVPEPCPLPLDVLAYKPSDKSRRYQQTWSEFEPQTPRRPRLRKIYPARERREPRVVRDRLHTACKLNVRQSGRAPPPKLFPASTKPWPCCKIGYPHCRPIRLDVGCPRGREPSCCKKRKTQFPSFSECKQYPLSPPIAPCECDRKPCLCEMWSFWRKKF